MKLSSATGLKNTMRKHFPFCNSIKIKEYTLKLTEVPASKMSLGASRKSYKQELSKRLLNIVLFGYPGSGRGSHGKALAKEFGLEYVATGEMLQQEIEKKSEIGKKITELYENGQLVGDEIVVQLIEKKLANHQSVKGFIFKGFPRTLVQSYILDGLVEKARFINCKNHRNRSPDAGADQSAG